MIVVEMVVLVLLPTATVRDPPPANSQIIHSRRVWKDQRPEKMSTKKQNGVLVDDLLFLFYYYLYSFVWLCNFVRKSDKKKIKKICRKDQIQLQKQTYQI